MNDRYNIYKTFDYEIISYEEPQEPWKNRPICPLCGRDHSQDLPVSVHLKCPHCGKVGVYKVMPHCPGGVSHGERHKCPNCGKEVFLIVYYDGDVVIERKE